MLVFSECLGLFLGPGPDNEVILTCFDLFDIFVCINVYRCNDICREKLTVEPFRNTPKIIPVCIQYDTIDANLQLTVHVYDLVIS